MGKLMLNSKEYSSNGFVIDDSSTSATETWSASKLVENKAYTDSAILTLTNMVGAKANSSDLATVATSGSYADLSNKPTIPSVYDGMLTIQKNGSTVQLFSANSSLNATANIIVPKVVGGTIIITFNGSGYRDVARTSFTGLNSKPDSMILSAQSARSCFIEYDWDGSSNTTLRIYGRQVPLAGGALSNLNGNVRVGWIAIDK